MNGTNRIAMFLLGGTLAAGLACSAYIISTGMVAMKQHNAVRVKGTAQLKIKSNQASWACQFTARTPLLKDSYDDLARSREIIKHYLAAQKLTEKDYALSSIFTDLVYKKTEKGERTNTIESYVLRQRVDLSSTNVDLIANISARITDLIKEGVEIQSFDPSYTYTDIESLKLELLAKATANAYERAQVLAGNSRSRVGKLLAASQGVFQITPVDSTDVSDDGSYDTRTIAKAVKAVVTLEFNIVK